MNSEIKMSVSSMTRKGDKKAVYVLFTDGDNSAEFSLPGSSLLSNRGFTKEEIQQLKEYIDNEQDYLFGLAKGINPLRGFMGESKKEQGKDKNEDKNEGKNKGKKIIIDEG